MVQEPTSATSKLKRELLIGTLCFFAAGAFLHFLLPWLDFIDIIVTVVSLMIDYPEFGALILGIPLLFYVFSKIHDHYAGT